MGSSQRTISNHSVYNNEPRSQVQNTINFLPIDKTALQPTQYILIIENTRYLSNFSTFTASSYLKMYKLWAYSASLTGISLLSAYGHIQQHINHTNQCTNSYYNIIVMVKLHYGPTADRHISSA